MSPSAATLTTRAVLVERLIKEGSPSGYNVLEDDGPGPVHIVPGVNEEAVDVLGEPILGALNSGAQSDR